MLRSSDGALEPLVRALREPPMRRIGDVGAGELVVVRGAVTGLSDARLASPLAGAPCLMWSVRVTKPRGALVETLLELQQGVEIRVTDATASARVDARDALFLTDRCVRADARDVSPRLGRLLRNAALGSHSALAIEASLRPRPRPVILPPW